MSVNSLEQSTVVNLVEKLLLCISQNTNASDVAACKKALKSLGNCLEKCRSSITKEESFTIAKQLDYICKEFNLVDAKDTTWKFDEKAPRSKDTSRIQQLIKKSLLE